MSGRNAVARLAIAWVVMAVAAGCDTGSSTTPTVGGLRAALITPADVPGGPHGSSQFSIDHITCVAPTDGAVEQVEVDYPVGPQTGPEPGLLVNVVVRFGDDKAAAFMAAERAEFGVCTTRDRAAGVPTESQLPAPHLGDDSVRYRYDQCDRFGCVIADVVFIRRGSVVSVVANFSSVLGVADPSLTDQVAARAASHLMSLTSGG